MSLKNDGQNAILFCRRMAEKKIAQSFKSFERSKAYNTITNEENNKGRNYMKVMCWGQGTLVAHI